MTNWKTFKLGDVLTLKRGYDLPKQDRVEGAIPIYSSSGLSGYHNEVKVKGPGVVTGRYGTLGEVFYTEEDYWPHNTTLYVKDFKGNYPKFIYYFIQTLGFNDKNDKTSVPGLNRNHLHDLQVSIPEDLPSQRRIAEILSVLDDKIELNRRMNQTLEQMAQTLFRQYFVDGIDEENLPEGWKATKLGEVSVRITKGTTPTTLKKPFVASGINFIKVESITESGTIDLNKLNYIDEETNQLLSRSKIQNQDILFSIAGTLGRMAVVAPDILPANTNQAVAIIRPDASKIEPLYIYYWLKLEKVREEAFSRKVHAVQANLSLGVLNEIDILIPPLTVQNGKFLIINNLFRKIQFNEGQIRKLTNLRDTLLPKLMSGEIDVMQTKPEELHEQVLS